jgi:hypothetical protein
MKFLIGVILCAISCFAEAKEKRTVFRIGSIASPPHVTDAQSNPPKGRLIEYLQAAILPPVIEKNNLKIEWHSAPLKRQFRDLENGHVDVLLMVLKTPEREKTYNYSSVALVTESPAMIVHRDDFKNRKTVSVREFTGKTIGLLGGALVPDFLKEHDIKSITVAGDDAGERIPNLVETKRVYAAFFYSYSIADGVAKMTKSKGKGENLRAVTIGDLPKYELYIAYNKKVSAKIRDEIDEQIRKYTAAVPQP